MLHIMKLDQKLNYLLLFAIVLTMSLIVAMTMKSKELAIKQVISSSNRKAIGLPGISKGVISHAGHKKDRRFETLRNHAKDFCAKVDAGSDAGSDVAFVTGSSLKKAGAKLVTGSSLKKAAAKLTHKKTIEKKLDAKKRGFFSRIWPFR